MTPITENFALVGSTANLTVTVPIGTIRLAESATSTVSVEIEGKGADQIEVTGVGDDITIGLRDQERRFRGGSHRVTIRVELPAGSELRLSTASADLFSEVDLANVKIATASGDVRLGTVGGDLEVKAASGDVDVDSVSRSVKANLASGDVRLRDVGGDLRVNTASGDISVQSVGGDVEAKSASGDVRIDRWSGRSFAARTISGDVRVNVPKGTRGDLSLRSLSGDIRMPNEPAPVPEGTERVERRIAFTSVSGDFTLDVE